MDSDIDMNTDIEENSPYQEGVISESYQRPDNLIFKSHQNWVTQVTPVG